MFQFKDSPEKVVQPTWIRDWLISRYPGLTIDRILSRLGVTNVTFEDLAQELDQHSLESGGQK